MLKALWEYPGYTGIISVTSLLFIFAHFYAPVPSAPSPLLIHTHTVKDINKHNLSQSYQCAQLYYLQLYNMLKMWRNILYLTKDLTRRKSHAPGVGQGIVRLVMILLKPF